MAYRGRDHVLCEIADLLKNNFRKEDVISRMGGDEFSVFVSGMRSAQEMTKRDRLVCRFIQEHFLKKGKALSVSIGIAPVSPWCIYTGRRIKPCIR